MRTKGTQQLLKAKQLSKRNKICQNMKKENQLEKNHYENIN